MLRDYLIHGALILFGILFLAVAPPAIAQDGDELANNGNWEAAISAFSAAQQVAPADAGLAAKLARINLLADHAKAAVDWAEKAVALAPDKAAYQLLLADAKSHYVNEVGTLKKIGLAREIRDGYLRATELEPDNAEAHLSLTMYYLMAPAVVGGSDKKAETEIAALERIDPAKAAMVQAQRALRDKDDAAAEASLRKAASLTDDDTMTVTLAQFLARRERTDEAMGLLRGVATKPAHVMASYTYGRLAANDKTHAATGIEALQAYLEQPIDWSEGNPPYCWARLRLGNLYELQENKASAEREYREALTLNPDFDEAREALDKLVGA